MKTNLLILITLPFSTISATALAGDIKPLSYCGKGPYNFPSPKTISTHTVVCPVGTTYYEAQVRDRLSNPESGSRVNIQIIKSPTNGPIRPAFVPSSNTTVCPAAGVTGYSGYSRVNGGVGTYTIKVTKSGGSGNEVYDISSHCIKVNANGTLTELSYPYPSLSAPIQQ